MYGYWREQAQNVFILQAGSTVEMAGNQIQVLVTSFETIFRPCTISMEEPACMLKRLRTFGLIAFG